MSDVVIGKTVPRLDALEKVTGAARYIDDLKYPGLLHAKILRSPVPHARIIRIDSSEALRLPGVRAVVTGADFPNYAGLYLVDRTLFAVDKVRYVGDPVAGVVAESEAMAEEALKLIRVEYEELPGVFDPLSAVQPGAPLIHERLGEYQRAPFILPVPGTNISNHFKLRKGDVERGFRDSRFVFEGTYTVPHIQHAPIETHVAVAEQDMTGKITVWSSCQSPNAVRKILASALGIPMSKLRLVTTYVGGGFGGKAGATIEALVVPLAMKVRGRPVKLKYTREEEPMGAYVRQGLVARIKTGVTENGRILAQKCEFYWDAGAYTEYGVNITRAAGYTSAGPYEIPNMETDSYCVYTNHPVGGPMRGFGMPEIHWAIEQHIDHIARSLGLDPVGVRRVNALRDGSYTATGERLEGVGLLECIDRAARAIGWGSTSAPSAPHKRRGKGLACMVKAPAMPPNAASSAIIKLNEDGTANLITGVAEIGQGAMTALAQIAAEELALPIENITVTYPDTDLTPYEWQTVASRITWSVGNAVRAAARDARDQIFRMASDAFSAPAGELELHRGGVRLKANPSRRLSYEELMAGSGFTGELLKGGPVIGRGVFVPEGITGLDPETGQGAKPAVFWTFGCQAAEVEVDTETGRVEVLRVVAAFDVGRVINPLACEGQVEGGVAMGLGSALYEQLVLDEGVPLNASFVDYKIPTIQDVPRIGVELVEVPQGDGPYGARGMGESAMVPTAAAVANAIYDAVGVRVRDLPITMERLLKEIAKS